MPESTSSLACKDYTQIGVWSFFFGPNSPIFFSFKQRPLTGGTEPNYFIMLILSNNKAAVEKWEREKKEFFANLRPILITGPKGAGKSTLAHYLANEFQSSFRHGVAEYDSISFEHLKKINEYKRTEDGWRDVDYEDATIRMMIIEQVEWSREATILEEQIDDILDLTSLGVTYIILLANEAPPKHLLNKNEIDSRFFTLELQPITKTDSVEVIEHELGNIGINNPMQTIDYIASKAYQKGQSLSLIINHLKSGISFKKLKKIDLEAAQIILGDIPGSTEDVTPVNRSIEFPPEHYQSGLSIINYFGTVLRQKYPNSNIPFRIEQDGLKVRLIIEPTEGEREIIEKTLDDYGAVVTGNLAIEEFLPNPIDQLELKNKLRLAHAELETSREIGRFKDQLIRSLEEDKRQLNQQVGRLLTSRETSEKRLHELLAKSIDQNKDDVTLTKALSLIETILNSQASDSGIDESCC